MSVVRVLCVIGLDAERCLFRFEADMHGFTDAVGVLLGGLQPAGDVEVVVSAVAAVYRFRVVFDGDVDDVLHAFYTSRFLGLTSKTIFCVYLPVLGSTLF